MTLLEWNKIVSWWKDQKLTKIIKNYDAFYFFTLSL